MHALLFAGGFGQRLWPISRKSRPKQFSALMGTKSFLRLAVERILPIVPFQRIYISTNEKFAQIILEQLPELPPENLILEPQRRDLAAAAALAFFTLEKRGIGGPIYFQWSDNYVGNEQGLRDAIQVGQELIAQDGDRIVFIGQTPRFASENLGWIEHGEAIGTISDIPCYAFRSWSYRPTPEVCRQMFESGRYTWNSGFFATTMEFVLSTFRRASPELSAVAEEIVSYDGTDQAQAKLRELYVKMPILHFDDAFLTQVKPQQAVILKIDLDWTDPGTLYGLKEALASSQSANVTQGTVIDVDCTDGLFINEEAHKTMAVMGLEGVMVVNTSDVTLVISKDAVRYIGKILDQLKERGLEDLL